MLTELLETRRQVYACRRDDRTRPPWPRKPNPATAGLANVLASLSENLSTVAEFVRELARAAGAAAVSLRSAT